MGLLHVSSHCTLAYLEHYQQLLLLFTFSLLMYILGCPLLLLGTFHQWEHKIVVKISFHQCTHIFSK